MNQGQAVVMIFIGNGCSFREHSWVFDVSSFFHT